MASLASLPMTFDMDKLTYEIFSVLETKFLFDSGKNNATLPLTVDDMKSGKHVTGKVRILSIDGSGATDGILAAKALTYLEAFLKDKTGDSQACVADYFDVVAGSSSGGILAALLFTRGRDGRPLCTAEEGLQFVTDNRRRISRRPAAGLLSQVFRRSKAEKVFEKRFGELTLKDTLKSVLIPCYDVSTHAPFLFSRADAVETDGFDFKMSDVCGATAAAVGTVDMESVDGKTRIVAVGGGVAMNNPTAAAITHVLNNKQEFPLCSGVEDLLVVSLGNGELDFGGGGGGVVSTATATDIVRIAGEGASDMVDQAVSMAFGEHRSANYIRIQANNIDAKTQIGLNKAMKLSKNDDLLGITEEMLGQRNVESILFQGKKMAKNTNLEKLEEFAGEVIKEQLRRKTTILPTVVLKQTSPSPRTSSATTLSSLSSSC